MGQPVPADDLPGSAVPASDLPSDGNASPAAKETPVTGTEEAGRLGTEALRGLASGGLPGAAVRLVGQGQAEAVRMLERGAYKAGGAVTDVSSKVLPPHAAAALGFGTNIGLQALPTVLGGAGGSRLAAAMERSAQRLMHEALKPDKFARESGAADRAINTLLDKGYNVTSGGVEKMTAAIDKLDDALDKAIAGSTADVSTLSVMGPVKQAIAKFKDGLDHAENTEAIRREVLKFFDHPEVQQALQIPVQTAQRIKRAIYTELGDRAYGLGIKPAAQAEGKKAIARGLKEGVERAVPESGQLNKEMGDLVNARDLAQQRVAVAANRDPLGLGAFSILHPEELAAWLANRSELFKSLAARGLHRGQSAIPTAGGAAAGGAVGAVEGMPER